MTGGASPRGRTRGIGARRAAWGIAVVLVAVAAIALGRTTTTSFGPRTPADSDAAWVRAHYRKREVLIPTRDGVRLFTSIYEPRDASPARRYPIVLLRTPFSVAPYGSDKYPAMLGPDRYMLREGYVFVYQDVRGRYASEGDFENVRPLLADSVKARDPRAADEATDTYDTIDWLLRNVPDNSGRVGQWGVSYAGFYTVLGMVSRHPALVASSPQAPLTDLFFEDFRHDGALTQGYFSAYPIFGVPRGAPTKEDWWLPEYQRMAGEGAGKSDYDFQLALGPLRNTTARYYAHNLLWQTLAAHPNYDAFWQARAAAPQLRGVRLAALVVGGWFDAEDLYGPLAVNRALGALSLQAPVTLVMGPWGHRGWAARDVVHSVFGDRSYGDSLELRYQRDVEAPFFRAHLKGEGRAPAPGALLFDTGRKDWVSFARWPASATQTRRYYLHADGALSLDTPTEASASRAYPSDPRHPVPSRCTGPTIEEGTLNHYMTDDQRCVAARPDVLTFQTAPLTADVTVAGPIDAALQVSTTGTDADFVVKLIDVLPDTEADDTYASRPGVHLAGYQQLVRGEIMRGRFRRSFAEPEPFVPDSLTEVDVRLQDVFHTFRAGHRIMVQVQGSWFPAFDRNPQRWVPNIFDARAEDFVAATQRLWMDRRAASVVVLPVLGSSAEPTPR